VLKLLAGEFAPWDMFGARVLAARRSYEGLKDAQCWVQEGCRGGIFAAQAQTPQSLGSQQANQAQTSDLSGGKNATPTATLSLVDGFAILSAHENADWEELVAFLRMQPWKQLQCDSATAERLPFPVEWRSMLVRFAAPKKESLGDIAPADDPGAVYDILARCFPDMQNRNDWMADLALRWRRGTARSWIMDNACTASALAMTEEYAFLGALGTLPEARGKGLAGRLLTHIAGEMAGREIWLACREELQGFYEGIGFVREGEMVTVRKEADA